MCDQKRYMVMVTLVPTGLVLLTWKYPYSSSVIVTLFFGEALMESPLG